MTTRFTPTWRARAKGNVFIQSVLDEFGLADPNGPGLELMVDGTRTIPAFQFREGELRPVMAQLMEVAERYELTEQDVLIWLVSETTLLKGNGWRPVDLIDTDPDELLRVAEAS